MQQHHTALLVTTNKEHVDRYTKYTESSFFSLLSKIFIHSD